VVQSKQIVHVKRIYQISPDNKNKKKSSISKQDHLVYKKRIHRKEVYAIVYQLVGDTQGNGGATPCHAKQEIVAVQRGVP
jgi:hypothetical protein